AIRKQLGYLRRNLGYIEQRLNVTVGGVALFTPQQLRRYWVIQQVYTQQRQMFENRERRCDHRIVSLQQPHVRPIVRGKVGRSVEFGAKLSVSLDEHGLAHVDQLRWDAFNEGQDLIDQVEGYRQRYGHYPKKVLADPLYGSRENRRYLKEKGIHYAGKPLGRPRKQTLQNAQQLKQAKAQRRQDYRERIPIEGKFGQGKQGYQLNRIKAKTA
ncbi:MAG: transposase, partial [Gammaproteobacteria bacterium]|nr:transposase [Gammaproteobacteria bacterium]